MPARFRLPAMATLARALGLLLAMAWAVSCGEPVVDYETLYLAISAEPTDKGIRYVDIALIAADGVHPSELGHKLMAEAWRKATGL